MTTRRKFTKEFQQTAVRRLKSGQSAAEVARALQVHPSDLRVGGGNCRITANVLSVASATNGRRKAGFRNWNARSVDRPWRSIF